MADRPRPRLPHRRKPHPSAQALNESRTLPRARFPSRTLSRRHTAARFAAANLLPLQPQWDLASQASRLIPNRSRMHFRRLLARLMQVFHETDGIHGGWLCSQYLSCSFSALSSEVGSFIGREVKEPSTTHIGHTRSTTARRQHRSFTMSHTSTASRLPLMSA